MKAVGKTIVQDSVSQEMILDDSVFQGTVLGPPLWNSFFADVATPAKSTGGREAVFADDLNVFQLFDRLAPPEECCEILSECRRNNHAWGERTESVSMPRKNIWSYSIPARATASPLDFLVA